MPLSELLAPDAAQVLVDQILELGPPALEARRGHVRHVVGNDFDVGLLGLHPGAGDIERAHRIGLLWHFASSIPARDHDPWFDPSLRCRIMV